ncbi:MAG: hypothetical protein HY928_01965 [Elusimicrobia bacterium]|nr:hypothetical protein [Elusimicrobiota bacterium]
MTCPNCAAPAEETAEECSACGVIFAKWKAKAEKAAAEKAAEPEPAPVPPPPPPSTLRNTVILLSCLCVAVYAVYQAVLRHVEPPAEKVGVVIKPEAYRAQISAIEGALYKDAPGTLQDAQVLSNEASHLAGSLMEKHPGNPLVRDAVGDIMEFSGAAAAAGEGLTMPPNARLDWTRRWEGLRARRFEKAPWFHAPVTSADGPPPDFEKAAQRILTTANTLKALAAALPAELEGFGDSEVGLAGLKKGGADKERLERWRSWAAGWASRVDAALAGFPRPDEIPAELQGPYDELVRAAQDTRNPPNPGPRAFVSAAELRAVYLPGKEARDAWVAGLASMLGALPDAVNGARQAKAAQQ